MGSISIREMINKLVFIVGFPNMTLLESLNFFIKTTKVIFQYLICDKQLKIIVDIISNKWSTLITYSITKLFVFSWTSNIEKKEINKNFGCMD